MSKLGGKRPSAPLVLSMVAVVLALTGTSIALPGTNTVDGGDIKKETIKGKDIKDETITGDQVKETSLKGVRAKASNVMAATVSDWSVATDCAVDSNTEGITGAVVGTNCEITFPKSVQNCTVGATPVHPTDDVSAQTSVRKISGAVVRVTRIDELGEPRPGLFSIIAVCP